MVPAPTACGARLTAGAGGDLEDWETAVLGAPRHHSCSQAFPPASLPLLPQWLPGAGNTALHGEPERGRSRLSNSLTPELRWVGGRFWGPWFPGGICSLQGWGPVSVLAGGPLNPECQSGPVVPATPATLSPHHGCRRPGQGCSGHSGTTRA